MKKTGKKWSAALMAGVLCLTVLSGCASEKSDPTVPSTSPSTSTEAPNVSQEETLEIPLDFTTYELPSMGLTASLPNALIEQMNQGDVAMLTDISTGSSSELRYGIISWNTLTGTDTEQDLECAGVLGVYQNDMVQQLDALTLCAEHKALGQSADGAYQYYLSTSSAADAKLTEEIRQIIVTITEIEAGQQSGNSGVPQSPFTSKSLGEFTTQDVNGQTITQDIFKDYDLTLVNVFATWCSPCVAEMPDLETLHQQLAERGVNVIGVVLDDVWNGDDEIVQQDLERVQQLVQKTGVTYPILLPDPTYFNGRLSGIEALPETFFVDQNGNIVGETYSGSGSLEDWLEVVEKELANLKEGA